VLHGYAYLPSYPCLKNCFYYIGCPECNTKHEAFLNISNICNIFSATTHNSDVLFEANVANDTTLDGGQPVIYQTIITNEGSGYDAATGRFTCTTPGLYSFSVQHCAERGRYSCLTIVKDGTWIMAGVVDGATYYPCATISKHIRLQAGEQVWVMATWESTLHNGPYRVNAFSGVLLR